MRRAIVGTAGHIDHGKTRLVEALTGVDCDRWAEEKERGITIDLGFAHLEAGDLQVGFVDVPGHERFLHNALAGLGGIRLMLLVIAADEGVMPQTREHLAICSLLGIPAGLVAVTKTDLVTRDLIELVRLETEELLAQTPFAGAPVLEVSSATGDGVAGLEAALVALAERHAAAADVDAPARLPVDRAFVLQGLGVVVTGTLASGRVAAGDTLELLPAGRPVRVRSIQVHGAERESAEAGERTALRPSGVELSELGRGIQLAAPGALAVTRSVVGRLSLLPEAPKPLAGSTPVRFHLLSSEVAGRMRPLGGEPIAPGGSGAVEIRLAEPVVAVRGDRFIVRRPSPRTTLGGGEILDPLWEGRRGRALARSLEALAGDDGDALEQWLRDAGEAGATPAELARRLGEPAARTAERLDALRRAQRALATPPAAGRWLHPAVYRRVGERAARVLRDYFARDRLARGMPKAEAVRKILPGRGTELADVYLGWLAKQKLLVVDDDRVTLPGRRAELSGEESELAAAILERFDTAGLEPPSPGALRSTLDAKPALIDGVTRYLAERGRLTRLPGELIVATSAVERLRRELVESDWERFTVGDFKERFGLSRKWAIPLLEHLDSIGATRRLGDERLIVRPQA